MLSTDYATKTRSEDPRVTMNKQFDKMRKVANQSLKILTEGTGNNQSLSPEQAALCVLGLKLLKLTINHLRTY
jgi:hypothetical protein